MEMGSNEATDQIIALVTSYGLNVIWAIVILIVGFWLAKRAGAYASRKLLAVDRFDETLASFLGSLIRYLVIAFTLIAVLGKFGVETTSLVALLGAAGLAIGLALQGTLSNVAAGVMLLLFRPFKIGDFVEVAGQSGSVKGINLFTTEMATGDNVHIIVPNADVWGGAVKNYSHHDKRRVDLVIGVGYDDDLNVARMAIMETIEADSRSLSDPLPLVAVTELADSSVNLVVRVWCVNADYWPLKFELTKTIKERLDKEGLSIPYPQHDVHLIGSQPS